MLLFIVFGTRNRNKTIGQGTFHCPKCGASRPYEHKKATRYFTLYFVPLIPMGGGTEFVECGICATAYEPRVLLQKPAPQLRQSLADTMNSVESALRGGQPIEHIIRDLTASGLDRDIAVRTVQSFAGEDHRMCAACGLTYSATADTCVGCGNSI